MITSITLCMHTRMQTLRHIMSICADSMVGAMMKAFNVTFYDDRRLCHMEGCTDTMIAFKWDHAVRDFMDPDKKFPTLCCLPKERSMQNPPVDECTDSSKYQEVRTDAAGTLPHYIRKTYTTWACALCIYMLNR